jgi:hypothetical protein
MTPLLKIKRCCLSGRVIFSDKADAERVASHLALDDVIEAVVNAPAIYKTLRSRSARSGARNERLYVIVGFTHEGIFVYTKGALRRFGNEDWFYLFVSAKRSIDE